MCCCFEMHCYVYSGCDLNTPRRVGPGGRGGEEAHDAQTPLHLCCQWGLESVVQTLVEHGADINVKVSIVPQEENSTTEAFFLI